ncbi:MAG: RHS repeat domain-containing protein, partial [Gammaproteobacteria bacterium]
WNARDQLVALSGPSGSGTFTYDAFGRRIEKAVNGATTGFIYDGAQAVAELKGTALDTVYHTGLLIDEVLARYGSSGNRSLLTDALMSTIAQTDDSQNAANFYAYSPYGEASTLGPDGGNSLQYTGRENDGTGLYYYRARYYDPVLKRFVSEDPIGLLGGINLYAYVEGNPISSTDPLGLAGGGLPSGSVINPLTPPGWTPPSLVQNSNWMTNTMGLMGQMPNPAPQIPGAYPGINFPWSLPPMRSYCKVCVPYNSPPLSNMCRPNDPPPGTPPPPIMTAPGQAPPCKCIQWGVLFY